MHVWSKLSQKYGVDGGIFGGFEGLWEMANQGKLNEHECIAVRSTFDNVIVKKEELPMMIDAYLEDDKEFSNSSLLEQVVIITDQLLNNEEMRGVCWNQTSVNSNPWADYDEEKDEEVPYNIFEGERHWFLNTN